MFRWKQHRKKNQPGINGYELENTIVASKTSSSSSSAKKSSPKTGNKNPGKAKSRTKKIFKAAVLTTLILFIAAASFVLYYAYRYIEEAPPFSPDKLQPSLTSEIVDKEGENLTDIHGIENRVEISLEQLPDHVIEAFLAIEDHRFYDHPGVDPYAVARAAWVNLQEWDWREQGGSTITQQLARNAFLTGEQTFERKVQEMWLALQIERHFSKEEILEKYLNYIYFGEGAYGVEAAAQTYFDKPAEDLSTKEAALLAGTIRSPQAYSPFNNPEVAVERQQVVLSSMRNFGFLSEESRQEKHNKELDFAEKPESEDYPYPYYIDYVLHHELPEILVEKTPYNNREEAYDAIYNDGLRIQTHLDTTLQHTVEEVLEREDLYPQNYRVVLSRLREIEKEIKDGYPEEVLGEEGIPQPQSAAVIADPRDGALLALAGGREYSSDNEYLRFLSPRQPGSAIKPILAYVPAMEEGEIVPASVIDDAPFARGNWAPENYDRQFRGLITVREALVHSLNVPAVKAFDSISLELGLEYGEKMGISTISPNDGLASVLGGMTEGVSPLEMAQSFAVLANNGAKEELQAIQKIEDRHGDILYEQENEPEQVISPESSYLMNEILKGVVTEGTGAGLQGNNMLAAKTGTTSDHRDAWLVAYSPDFVASFWLGHDLQRMGRIPGGSSATVPFMNAILDNLLEEHPPSEFEIPPEVTEPISVCNKSGLLPGDDCSPRHIVQKRFPRGEVPTEECEMHVEKRICEESGELAGDYCPEDKIVKKVFLDRPDYEVTDGRWIGGAGRGPEDAGLQPPEKECSVHTKPEEPLDAEELSIALYTDPLALEISWAHLAEAEIAGEIERYDLYRQVVGVREDEDTEGENGGMQLIQDGLPFNEIRFLDRDVNPGQTYYYRLEAIGGDDVVLAVADGNTTVPDAEEKEDDIEDEDIDEEMEELENGLEEDEKREETEEEDKEKEDSAVKEKVEKEKEKEEEDTEMDKEVDEEKEMEEDIGDEERNGDGEKEQEEVKEKENMPDSNEIDEQKD